MLILLYIIQDDKNRLTDQSVDAGLTLTAPAAGEAATVTASIADDSAPDKTATIISIYLKKT